jgi:phospholipid-transporting ATPase
VDAYWRQKVTFLLQVHLHMSRDTAKNIAYSTGLFSEKTRVFDLDSLYLGQKNILDRMTSMLETMTTELDSQDDIALIVDGDALDFALDPLCIDVFVAIIGKIKTAICCRATPLHKATLVDLMRKKYKMVGLAIGDGANDVTMIQKAKVGIGIAGKEGSQAKQASDYCLQRFFHLKRLLFVHGRYSLTRSALFVQYSFYKSVTLTFIQVSLLYDKINGF